MTTESLASSTGDGSLLGIAALFAMMAALGNVAGGALLVARRRWSPAALDRFLAFSAGFLLSAALLEMWPESLQAHPGNAVYGVAGFLTLHLVERLLMHRHVHHHGQVGGGCCPEEVGPRRPWGYIALLGMAVHTFFDGVSITAGLAAGLQTALLVFAAVLLHKLPDGLVAASLMLAAGEGRARAMLAAAALGTATLAGSLVAWTLSSGASGDGIGSGAVLAFSAGLFTYVAASDLIPEVNRSHDRTLSVYLGAGVLLFFSVSRFLGSFLG